MQFFTVRADIVDSRQWEPWVDNICKKASIKPDTYNTCLLFSTLYNGNISTLF